MVSVTHSRVSQLPSGENASAGSLVRLAPLPNWPFLQWLYFRPSLSSGGLTWHFLHLFSPFSILYHLTHLLLTERADCSMVLFFRFSLPLLSPGFDYDITDGGWELFQPCWHLTWVSPKSGKGAPTFWTILGFTELYAISPALFLCIEMYSSIACHICYWKASLLPFREPSSPSLGRTQGSVFTAWDPSLYLQDATCFPEFYFASDALIFTVTSGAACFLTHVSPWF